MRIGRGVLSEEERDEQKGQSKAGLSQVMSDGI